MQISPQKTEKFIRQLKQGKVDQAVQFANEISRQDPDNPVGYAMLGDALKQKGEFEKATSFYRYSLQKNPQQPGLYLALGEAYMLTGENSKALDSYSQALYMAPDNIDVLQKTGHFLTQSGYLEEAQQVLEKSIGLGNSKAINSLLDLFIYQGDKARIRQFISQHEATIKQHGGDFELARAAFTLGEYQHTIDTLKAIGVAGRNIEWRRAYYHLLASAHERMGDYEAAFELFQRQNSLTPSQYDGAAMTREVMNVIDKVEHMPSLSRQSQQQQITPFSPLFIIGLPRSGTSLLEQVLNTSTHVVSGGELLFIEAAYRKYIEQNLSLPEIAAWYREKIAFITKNQKIPKAAPRWVTDKLPSNFMYLGFIKNLLPDARFLYCQRNALDNGLSIYKQNFLDMHSYAREQSDIGHFIALERKVMRYWQTRYAEDIYTVNYERLVTRFDDETRNIFEHCELRWNEDVKHFHRNQAYCHTASFDQVREPLHDRSVGLHKHYQAHLATLKQALLKQGVDCD
jgi:tetratricopeptide (TPR) repeat protein